MPHRRAPIVLTATALGLAATLGFNARHAEPAGTAVTSASPPSASSSGGGASSASGSPGTTTAGHRRSSSSPTKTVTSAAESTPYGDVQLKVTISNSKITNIEPVQLPASDPRSIQINDFAAPLLRQSALAKQSGSIDAVSGATFTSNGYQAALQSALDQAGVTSSTSGPTA